MIFNELHFHSLPTSLLRATNESEALPDDLKTPVGIADSLLDAKTADVYGQIIVADGMDQQSLGDSTAEDSSSRTESGTGDGVVQQGTVSCLPFLLLAVVCAECVRYLFLSPLLK